MKKQCSQLLPANRSPSIDNHAIPLTGSLALVMQVAMTVTLFMAGLTDTMGFFIFLGFAAVFYATA